MSENFIIYIWVRSQRFGCLVTWFCYHLIAKPGNKTAASSRPDPYAKFSCRLLNVMGPPVPGLLLIMLHCHDNAGKKRRTNQTFPVARPKCLMGDFTNLYGIYKAHQTNGWWTMKVFRRHCHGPTFQWFVSYLLPWSKHWFNQWPMVALCGIIHSMWSYHMYGNTDLGQLWLSRAWD